jgi:hypothetical protein
VEAKPRSRIAFLATSTKRFEHPPSDTPDPARYSLGEDGPRRIGSTMRSATPRQSYEINAEAPAPDRHANIDEWGIQPPSGIRTSMDSQALRTMPIHPQGSATPADHSIHPAMDRGCRVGHGIRFRTAATVCPGPGAYRPESVFPRSEKQIPSSFFASQVARDIHASNPRVLDTPGLNHAQWGRARASAPFGTNMKHRKLWVIARSPGPSDYTIDRGRNLRALNAPFGANGDRAVYETSANPSPADYTVASPRRPRDLRMAPFLQRSPRFGDVRQNNPFTSPGEYETGVREAAQRAKLCGIRSPVFKMSHERSFFDPPDENPGPSRYSPDQGAARRLKPCIDSIERSPPGTFIGTPIVETPGPGAYNEESPLPVTGGYIRHTERKLFDTVANAPPPGTYEIAGSMVKPSFNQLFPVKLSG